MAKKSTQSEFEIKARHVHGDRYTYGEYNGIMKAMEIHCDIHGTFLQTASDHLHNKAGCRECNGSALVTPVEFEQRARKIHGDRYTYGDFVDMKTPITIICEHHGAFIQTPSNHLNHRQNCPRCYGRAKTQEAFEAKAREVHGDRYDYGVFTNNRIKMEITCPLHGNFMQSPASHLNMANGCPKCASSGYSKKQIKWLDYISARDGIHIQHKLNLGEFLISGIGYVDGYCADTNTVYEFHGDFYHGNPIKFAPHHINPRTKGLFGELYTNTIRRDAAIVTAGFNLVVIWEHEWDDLTNTRKVYNITIGVHRCAILLSNYSALSH